VQYGSRSSAGDVAFTGGSKQSILQTNSWLILIGLSLLLSAPDGFAQRYADQVPNSDKAQSETTQLLGLDPQVPPRPNPFIVPWFYTQRLSEETLSILLKNVEEQQPDAAKKAEAPTKTKYVMTPDPYNLGSGAPDYDALAVPSASVEAEAKVTNDLEQIRKPKKEEVHLHSKYDVNRIGMRGIGSGMNFYSIEKEQTLGRELAADVEHQVRLLNDPVITEYVNRVGQKLVRNSDAQVPFTIKVVDDDEINAFALPGGFFYVNTGLIEAADNEAELAGVMAHEIAHVAARHATKNATKRDIWDFASIPLIFVGGPVGLAVRQVSQIAVPMSFLKFSRDAEREADLLGMQYQYAAGYDPQSFVDFFEKLQIKDKHKHNALARAFATHPMTEDRIHRAEVELETMLPARDDYILTTSDFETVRVRLMQVTNGRKIDAGKPAQPTLRKRNDNGNGDQGPVLRKPEK
jgi:Zn-dependent protease with chaperone function